MDLMQQTADIISQVEDGMLSELDGVVQLREIKTKAELLLASIKAFESENIEEIDLQSKDHPNGYMGYNITYVNGRKTYDFSKVTEVANAKRNLKDTEERYKKMLEAKISGAVHANVTEDGQVLDLPEIKYGKGYLKVTVAKS